MPYYIHYLHLTVTVSIKDYYYPSFIGEETKKSKKA